MARHIKVIITLFFFVLSFIGFFQSEFQSYGESKELSSIKLGSAIKESKVILLIIDALRYDYLDRFSSIVEVRRAQPKNSFLTKCTVGNPTMTTQRVESLMTGSEIYSPETIIQSFFSQKVLKDNLITQLNRNNKSSLVLGDNTWSILFNFTRQYICENTFDILDFQTCDNIVYEHLVDNVGKFDLIVGHLLAIDHIGHATSALTDSRFQIKMNLISTYLAYLMENLPKDTVLLITGDHGMRADGNHGGLSEQQVQTFLFAYSKRPFIYTKDYLSQVIKQTDIASTLSVLLGVPIPSNSIGVPIQNLLPIQFHQHLEAIYETLFNSHFSRIISDTKIECPQMKSTDKSNYLKKAREVSELCLSKLSHSKPFYFWAVLSLSLLTGFCLVYALLLRLTLKEYVISFASLFAVQFSWFLIRNTSTYLLSVVAFVVLVDSKLKTINKIGVLSIVSLVLCQVQPPKVNEYEPSIIYSEILSSLIKTTELQVLCLSYFFLTYFRKNKSNPQRRLHIVLLFLNYLNLMVSHMNIPTYYSLRILICIVSLSWIAYALLKLDNDSQRRQTIIFCIQNFICIVLGVTGMLVVLSVKAISKMIQNSELKIQISFLTAELVWWVLGNRYEYSSIDIKKSYILAQTYNSILNPLFLAVYLLSSYILSLSELELYRQVQEPLNQFQEIVAEEPHQDKSGLPSRSPISRQNSRFRVQILKYVSVLMFSLVSCCANLYLNNEKILFTVVYVPLVVLTAFRVVSLAVIVSFLSLK